MSYMRGKYYLWTGSDGVHLWAFDGEDGWKDCGWAESVKSWKPKRGQKPSGVCIPEPVLDEYVAMRFAELVDGRKVTATIRRASKNWRGNAGAISLLHHGKAIVARIGSLKPDPERLRWTELMKKHTRQERLSSKPARGSERSSAAIDRKER
ncbi:MAG: hypothetical protein QOJ40_537 [Verrucomicrobiota bacterium]